MQQQPELGWFNDYGLPQQGKARVFAFPFSGGGSLAYFKWVSLFRDGPVDFISLQLPGRENRIREAAIGDLPQLLGLLREQITPLLDKPFVFFGHSLGALLAFELCRSLRKHQQALPNHLFVSAFRAPDRPNPNRELHQLPRAAFVQQMAAYGGTSPKVLGNQELMDMFLPMLRADFQLHETYHYQPEAPLHCPITLFSGSEDPLVPADCLPGWAQQTSVAFEHIRYRGGHFFQQDQMGPISQHLKAGLGL